MSKSLAARIDQLEAKHAGPVEIEVWIVDDDGRHYRGGDYPGGPSLTQAEFDAQSIGQRVIAVDSDDQHA